MLLQTITDNDIDFPIKEMNSPDHRTTARAVLLDAEGHIAVMYVGTGKYHKLPGGGLEAGETLEEGLAREIHEETGCLAKIISPLGEIDEHRGHMNLIQCSAGFLAKVNGEKGTPPFDEGERLNGFELKWLTPDEALKLLKSESKHPDYEARFINRREITFLEAAIPLLN